MAPKFFFAADNKNKTRAKQSRAKQSKAKMETEPTNRCRSVSVDRNLDRSASRERSESRSRARSPVHRRHHDSSSRSRSRSRSSCRDVYHGGHSSYRQQQQQPDRYRYQHQPQQQERQRYDRPRRNGYERQQPQPMQYSGYQAQQQTQQRVRRLPTDIGQQRIDFAKDNIYKALGHDDAIIDALVDAAVAYNATMFRDFKTPYLFDSVVRMVCKNIAETKACRQIDKMDPVDLLMESIVRPIMQMKKAETEA